MNLLEFVKAIQNFDALAEGDPRGVKQFRPLYLRDLLYYFRTNRWRALNNYV
jgi:hypothetical protein